MKYVAAYLLVRTIANERARARIGEFPHGPLGTMAICGPPGCGKMGAVEMADAGVSKRIQTLILDKVLDKEGVRKQRATLRGKREALRQAHTLQESYGASP